MQLEQKYELLEAISDVSGDRDLAIPAWERSTGKQVFVHVLAGGYNAENNVVLTAVGRLPAEHRQHVLGAGDHLGNAYVITDALPWGVSLRSWVASMQAKMEAQPPAADTSAPAASKPAIPDPATLIRAGTWRIPVFNPDAKPTPVEPPPPQQPSAADPAVTPDRPVAEPGPVAVPEKEPGEFTRMIRTMQGESPAAPEAAVPAAARSDAPANEPGEFTRLIRTGKADAPAAAEMPSGAPAAPVPPAASAAPTAPAAPETKPGEFTQMLRSFNKPETQAPPAMPAQRVTPPPPREVPPPILTPTPPPPPPAEVSWQFDKPGAVASGQFQMPSAAPPPIQPTPARPAPGEFTGMFQGKQHLPQQPAPGISVPPAAPQAEGEFTRMMRTPATPAGGVFAPPVQGGRADADLFTAPGPVAPGAKGGPSFTQVIAARTPAPPAAAVPAPKEPAQAGSKPPYLVLAIVLGVVFVLLIALVLILVLRH